MTYPQPTSNGCDTDVAIPKHVHITSNDGQVDQPTISVNRLLGEEVTWSSNGTKALIVFASSDGSPFQEAIFHVPAGGSVSSGPVQTEAESKGYKYTVIGQLGINDPVIIVEP
jgi:hypothetical protein